MKLGKEKSLEEQLKEHKEKEKIMLKKIADEKENKRKEEELRIQIEKEQKLLEEKKTHEKHMRIETEKAKEKQRQQEEHAKLEAQKAKLKDELKDHPEGCFCPKCEQLRNVNSTENIKEKLEEGMERAKTMKINDKEVEIAEEYSSVEESIKATLDKPKAKKSRFNFKFNLPKPKKTEQKKEKSDDPTNLAEYHKVKKDPKKLIAFIKNQRIKLNKPNKKDESPDETDAKVHPSFFTDLTVLGIRLAIGFSFIAHGLSKLAGDGTNFATMLTGWGIPPELALPIGYVELLAGVFITAGFLTRISSIFIGIIMLGAIFVIKGTNALIGQGGVELDLIILACVALLGIFGPGKLSVANIGIKGMIFDRKLQ